MATKNLIEIETFKNLLSQADLITVNGSPYLHTWDFEDGYLIFSKYEEDGLTYVISIDEDEVLKITKEKKVYKIVCEKTNYEVELYALSAL